MSRASAASSRSSAPKSAPPSAEAEPDRAPLSSLLRTASVVTAFAAVALGFPAAAVAHAVLLRAQPAAGAALERSPSAARFVFSDSIQPLSGIAAVDTGGASVQAGRPKTTQGGRVLVVPLRGGLPSGTYSVRWRVLSDDGHTTEGVVAFGVGGPPRGGAMLSTIGTGPSVRDVVGRWLFLFGLMLAFGILAFQALVLPRAVAGGEQHLPAARRLLGVVVSGFGAVCAGALLLIVGREDVFATRFGRLYAVATAVALLGALAAFGARHYRRARPVAAAAALCALPIPALAGHALDRGGPRPLNAIVDVVHTASAAIWLGGLLALLVAVVGAPTEARAAVLRHFSALALVAVLLLSATGVVRALFELASLSQLWSAAYGRVLLVKTALLGVLVALGWANRSPLIPGGRFRQLRQNVTAEIVLIAGVVLAVAFLTGFEPGRQIAREAKAAGPIEATCDHWLELVVVLAVCDGPTQATLTITDAHGRLFKYSPAFRVAKLVGRPLASGDQILLSGIAPQARLTALVVTRTGRPVLYRFDDLELTDGTPSTILVSGTEEVPMVRLEHSGVFRDASAVVRNSPRRYVAELRVVRDGAFFQVSFVAPGTEAEILLLHGEPLEGLLEEGEVEGDVIARRTIRTRMGEQVRVVLPARAGAEYVWVRPLARRQVLPALEKVPGA